MSGSSPVATPDVPPAHIDSDGPWWAVTGLEHWWVRQRDDGRWEARHRHGYLADVEAPNLYVLAVLAQHRAMAWVHALWERLPIHQMVERVNTRGIGR